MFKPQKTDAGTWRVRVYYYDEFGKRHAKSITAPTEKEAIRRAAEYDDAANRTSDHGVTVGQAVARYIDLREPTCSPTTISKYRNIDRLYLDPIREIRADRISDATLQQWINALVNRGLSPKTVTNAWGLVLPAIRMASGRSPSVMLPQKKLYIPSVPDEDVVMRMLDEVRGTEMELPILFAAVCGMRMSEVCGLRWSDISDDTITVRNARVYVDGANVDKTTKSVSGTRILPILPPVRDALGRVERKGEYVVQIPMRGISKRFDTIQKKLGVDHFRFHDLRHYAASICSRLGIPDQYAMQFVGHSTVAMTHRYQHIMGTAYGQFASRLSDFYEDKK